MISPPRKPRILMFSQRNIFKKAFFRGPHYEFEDLISKIDSADILAPQATLFTLRHTVARLTAYHAPIVLNPGIRPIEIKQQYDVFLAVCGLPGDLLMVNAVRNWRDTCKISICLLDEIWVKQMDDLRYFLRILEKFDVVVLYYSQSVKPLSERIGRKCVFLPPGVDALRFCPYPELPPRVVDVCSIGRRSDITHQHLMSMTANNSFFYLHDSVDGDQAINLAEHRTLLSNIAKRSRYFIVNPGLIDRPDRRGEQIEIGNRYFEGAASGTIMVGERPSNGEFENLFDWPDAVIHLPYGSRDIDMLIRELDRDPERQERIRRTNVVQSLMRHDWVYRWEAMLTTVGMQPMPELYERKRRLGSMADAVLREDACGSGNSESEKMHEVLCGSGCVSRPEEDAK
jgi:hypothetical protein